MRQQAGTIMGMTTDSRARPLYAPARRARWPVDIPRCSKATAHWEFPIVESPQLVSMGRPIFAAEITPSRGPISNPTACLIPGPVQPTPPNGIRIRSAIFSQSTRQTDRLTEVFRFIKMAAVHHVGFVLLLIVARVGSAHTRQCAKFGKVGQTVAETSQFNRFPKWRPPPSCFFQKFKCLAVRGL